MKSLTWRQVHAWRLAQHGLSPRLQRQDFLEAVTRTCGIQAQIMSAAELALWARVDGLTRQDVQSALWRDRTLIKTWAMRATLHLIPAGELPLYVAARSAHEGRDWLKEFIYYGASQEQYEAIIAAVPQVLGSEPMTREQLSNAVARHIGAPELAKVLAASSWGSLWKPSAWRGDLCFGPSQGQNVTFVRPSAWVGDAVSRKWQPVEPHLAFQEIARRYLRAYGPARLEDFVLWWGGGTGLIPARKLFKSLEDELEPVDVEGWQALALRSTIEPMQSLETAGETPGAETVRLLPLFDAYTLGIGRNIEELLPMLHKLQVYRPQGWISAVVLVDGRIKGVWEHRIQRSQAVVKVHLFSSSSPASSPAASIRQGIEAEAESLSGFLNIRVVVEFEDN